MDQDLNVNVKIYSDHNFLNQIGDFECPLYCYFVEGEFAHYDKGWENTIIEKINTNFVINQWMRATITLHGNIKIDHLYNYQDHRGIKILHIYDESYPFKPYALLINHNNWEEFETIFNGKIKVRKKGSDIDEVLSEIYDHPDYLISRLSNSLRLNNDKCRNVDIVYEPDFRDLFRLQIIRPYKYAYYFESIYAIRDFNDIPSSIYNLNEAIGSLSVCENSADELDGKKINDLIVEIKTLQQNMLGKLDKLDIYHTSFSR
jgi:hypothetical protein